MTKDKTIVYRCEGGPFDRQKLRLSEAHPYTFTFNLRDWKGRYANNRIGDAVLYWEQH